jgi:glutamate N-acetyltransferase/amino-acid N-acetyltransferase
MGKKDKKKKAAKAAKLEKKLAKERKRLKKAEASNVEKPAKTAPPISPLAPAAGFPALPEIAGVRFASIAAGVRYSGRTDVMLVELAPGTAVAGVFTRSATRAAPVLDCQAKIGKPADAGAAFLVNSGNANAFTGAAGRSAVVAITDAVADRLGLPEARVFTSSTGVIGEPLPHDRITQKIGALAETLSPDGIAAAARAIMTTDTFPKGAGAELEIDGQTVRIAGIAKGSGMIAPDMATMLVYIFTDARIAQDPLQRMVAKAADETFNCITVDGDTSTSDTLLVAATGLSAEIGDARTKSGRVFQAALQGVMLDLAHQVVRDGEGATKFVEVSVTGARDDADARKVALAIANSPLVKTAIAGEDPNWGRIVMAVGKSGADADRDRLTIRFGDILVAENGWVAESYAEADGAAYMKAAGPVRWRRSGHRVGQGHCLDLRPDARLHLDQRGLPLMKTVLVAAVALIDRDGRVLLSQRPEGKAMAGLWEFPGGKVEAGETPEHALIRELEEELGIDTWESCLAPLTFASHSYEAFHLLMPLFACRKWQGQPQGREGQALAWVAVNRLRDYPMPPADLPLIPVLRDWL